VNPRWSIRPPRIKLQADDNYSRSLAVLSQPSFQQGPLGAYAVFYAGEASLKLGPSRDAKRAFQALQARKPVGYLEWAAAIGEAEADEAQADFAGAGHRLRASDQGRAGSARRAHDAARLGRARSGRRHGESTGSVRARLLRIRVE